MSEVFEPGDIVQLKSGGPQMTVEQVGKEAMLNVDRVWCVWFEKVGQRQQLMKEAFPPVVLVKYDLERALAGGPFVV